MTTPNLEVGCKV